MDLRSQIKTSELHGSDKTITDSKAFVGRKLSTETSFSVCLMCVCIHRAALCSSVKSEGSGSWRPELKSKLYHSLKACLSVPIPTHKAIRTENTSLGEQLWGRSLSLQPEAHGVCSWTLQHKTNKNPPNLEFNDLCRLRSCDSGKWPKLSASLPPQERNKRKHCMWKCLLD